MDYSVWIAIAAVVYGVLTGRAKAARLRSLGNDLQAGRMRGYAVIALVGAVVVLVQLSYWVGRD
jgi:hypothetical protein